MLEWMERPHRRLNALSGEWVLVSPQRAQRPWQGGVERIDPPAAVPYDPACYLCPGNERARGTRNPEYAGTFVFDNDFPALLAPAPDGPAKIDAASQRGLLVAAPEAGICRVMCFSPRHDLSIPSMELEALRGVVESWCSESAALRSLPFVRYVQIFENRGAQMGASNSHPHCQIWAVEHVPNELLKEDHQQGKHAEHCESCMLCDYVRLELPGERVVCQNPSFLAVIPFWALWPFEILVLPKRHCARLDQTTTVERENLSAMLRDVTLRYDRLFGIPFPYSMGFHEQPKESSTPVEAWHYHAHFYPPLLRSATVRKFMVGFELLAGPQRDITPESAAEGLRRTFST
ncbi:MAG: UDP-glucose--hexose-1-phosphate uridylyltransferase [Candidatus Eremiobacteraeota bacterium]|nr:UDP-glucose--hexose-1-phosphate uridylyltransferase [Candidatus Eremiobacteraeota bacterium]